MRGKDVLVIAPGKTYNTHRNEINNYIEKVRPIVISVNFVMEDKEAYAFFGNPKRYARLGEKRVGHKVIISSNIRCDDKKNIVVNYHSLINRGYKYFENSTIMLLNLLKRVNPGKIAIAGFDGFREDEVENYADSSFQNKRHIGEFATLNKEITEMFSDIIDTMYPDCVFEMITPSLYESALKK